jgi:hypothetical protein
MVVGQTANEVGDQILIKSSEPYLNVVSVTNFVDVTLNETVGSYFDKSFRWSINDINYSDWITLSQPNLENLVLDGANPFWIQYKYEVSSIVPGETIEFVSITLSTETIDGSLLDVPLYGACDAECNGCASLIFEDCCDDNRFNPYNLGKASEIYNQLSTVVSNIFGHCVRYFRLEEFPNSRDVILKEFSLYKGKEVKDLKIMVPDNELPTRELAFTQMNIDMPDSFEIHIVKAEFERVFGSKKRPKENDYLWFPLTDRVYEVNSIALPDDFMFAASYYRVNLVIHQERSNQDYTDNTDMYEEIDSLEMSQDEMFGTEIDNEYKKIRKNIQYNTIGLGDDDSVRSGLSKNLVIENSLLRNNFTVVSKHYYDLSSVTDNETSIVYRNKKGLAANESISLTFWLQHKYKGTFYATDDITTMLDQAGKLSITVVDVSPYFVNDIIEITSVEYNGLYFVTGIDVPNNELILSVDYVGNDLAGTPTVVKKENISLINKNNLQVSFIEDKMFILLLDTLYTFDIISDENWNGYVINISNKFRQLSVFKWSISSTIGNITVNTSTKLILSFVETISLTSDVLLSSSDEWSIQSGNCYFTNFRLFRYNIEEEQQSLILNQYVVKDTHLAEIVDNAIPELRLTKVNNYK